MVSFHDIITDLLEEGVSLCTELLATYSWSTLNIIYFVKEDFRSNLKNYEGFMSLASELELYFVKSNCRDKNFYSNTLYSATLMFFICFL